MKDTAEKLRITAVVLLGVVIAATSAEAQWSRFGDAISVIDGPGPNTGAIQLSSTCTKFTGTPPACDFSTFTFSGVAFRPSVPLTFAQILELSSDFNVGAGDCGGGSPRFQINIDSDGDGVSNGNVFVHFGPSPFFEGCFFGWQSTGNLIGNNDVGRYDSSQLGGPGFGTYNDALAAVGNFPVVGVQLVVDGGWRAQRGQAVLVDNVNVNTDKLTK